MHVLGHLLSGVGGCLTIEGTDVAGRITAQLINDTQGNEEYVDFYGNVPTKLVVMHANIVLGMMFAAVSCYCGLMVALYMRAAIQEHVHKLYFKKKVAYVVNQLDPSIDTVDQRIAQDLELLTSRLQSALFGSPENPTQSRPGVICGILEMMVLFIYGFYLNWFLATFVISVLLGGTIMFAFQNSTVGKTTLPVQNAEGLLRYWHLRIRDYAESICFYKGETTEAESVNQLLQDVTDARLVQLRAYIPILVTANAFGYLQVIGTLVVLNFATLYETGPEISSNDYGTMQSFFYTFGIRIGTYGSCLVGCGIVIGLVHRVGELIESCEKHQTYAEDIDLDAKQDETMVGMNNVTVSTPNGMKLIDGLTFEIRKGESLIIMGQSGCGKSSLLRVLSGLWRTSHGTVTRPFSSIRGGFLFLPQKSYVTEGTFLEQIIYPLEDTGGYDEMVMDIIKMADLEDTVKVHGLNSCKFWEQIFSGGELQRIGFARLFFHRPTFALMDEATSALDMELEAKLMSTALALGITMINVAHRPSLLQYHNRLLKFSLGPNGVAYTDNMLGSVAPEV